MRSQTLAARFRHTIILIIAASAAATALTYAFALYLFNQSLNSDIYPADYYEQQVSDIESFIHEKNTALLSPSGEIELKGRIQGDGMLYQAVDDSGNILYGTIQEKPFESAGELFGSLAGTKVLRLGYYTYTVPVIDDTGNMAGAVLLFYKIRTTFANARGRVVFTFTIASLFSPFFYILGFTLLFSKIFSKNINQPLQILTEASKKIKEKDLDFDISYHSENELGRLCTAFSEMKEELKKSLSAQWKMEQERVWMVEALAHDLKSPLSIIMGYADALIDNHQGGDDKLLRYLAVIRDNAGKSAALVQQMQYTSDLEGPAVLLCPVPVHLPDLLSKKVHDYELKARQKEVSLNLNMHGEIPSPVQVDTDKLTRILDNIISNSLEYTPAEGRIDIDVTTDDTRIFYEICDSGSGFSPKDLKMALDRFYRGDESRQSKGGHSGLGLYIASQLAGQLGGAVTIKNSESGGACVKFWHSIIS